MGCSRAPAEDVIRRSQLLHIALASGIALWVWAGWRLFWFLTDDAYIAFRYVRNLVDGYGPVWNRAPFLPVEGYSSPLWVGLLALIWRVLGIPPTQAANVIGLYCGYASLIVLWWIAQRASLPEAIDRARGWLFAIAALGVLLNRHFYTWLSSGLETPLFNLCAIGWVALGLVPERERDARWAGWFAFTGACAALARPDGLLFLALGVPQLVLFLRREPLRRWLAAGWPLGAVAAHLIARQLYYGAWLPNTYYAKYVKAWPEAGLRYAGSFLIENGLWLWLLLVALWAVREVGVRWRARRWPSLALSLTWCAVVAHVAYYTLLIGGDHFEYRVYSAWLPLAFVSCVPLGARLSERPRIVGALCAMIVLLSLPIPWKHWLDTHQRVKRDETRGLWLPLAQDFPPPFRSLVERWDAWQSWLIRRSNCLRHQEHKAFVWYVYDYLPPPAARPALRWADRPVVAESSIGVVGYELPEAAVIDLLGLNDYVIARTPPPKRPQRRLAHERHAPPGYVECFQPNILLPSRRVFEFTPRELSDSAIRACELRFRRELLRESAATSATGSDR